MGAFPNLNLWGMAKKYLDEGIERLKSLPSAIKTLVSEKRGQIFDTLWPHQTKNASGALRDDKLKQHGLKRADRLEALAGESNSIAATHLREVAKETRQRAEAIPDRTIPEEGSPEEAERLEKESAAAYGEHVKRILSTNLPPVFPGQEDISKSIAQRLSKHRRGLRLLKPDSFLGKLAQQTAVDINEQGKEPPSIDYLLNPPLSEEDRKAGKSQAVRQERFELLKNTSQIIHRTIPITDPLFPHQGDCSFLVRELVNTDPEIAKAFRDNKSDIAVGFSHSGKEGGQITVTLICTQRDHRAETSSIDGQSIVCSTDGWFARIEPEKRKKDSTYWNLFYGEENSKERFHDGFTLLQLAKAEALVEEAKQQKNISWGSIKMTEEKIRGKDTIWVTVNINGKPDTVGIAADGMATAQADAKSPVFVGTNEAGEGAVAIPFMEYIRRAIGAASKPEKVFQQSQNPKKEASTSEKPKEEEALF